MIQKNLSMVTLSEVTSFPALEKLIADDMGRAVFIEAATSLFKSPAYLNCTVESVLGCLLKAAIFNFRLSPELGEAWAIPRNVKTGRKIKNASGKDVDEYETVCQFQIGYKGWMKLASATGRVSFWDFSAVWSKDKFDYELGSNQFIKHTPSLDTTNRGNRIAFWAKAKLTDGNEVFHIITAQDAEEYRRFSETQYNWDANRQKSLSATPKGIWATSYDAMALRSPIKEIATKKIPRTEIINQAIESDDSITRVNPETGEVMTTKSEEVKNSIETIAILHDDYKDEISMCETKAQVRTVFEQRVHQMDDATKELYIEFCSQHAKALNT